jgi:hypothetical protein
MIDKINKDGFRYFVICYLEKEDGDTIYLVPQMSEFHQTSFKMDMDFNPGVVVHSVISTPERQKQDFNTSLGCIVRPCFKKNALKI